MSDQVAVALIALVGTVATAGATVAAAYARELTRRIGQPNGAGSLAAHLEVLESLLRDHLRDDERRFASLEARIDNLR